MRISVAYQLEDRTVGYASMQNRMLPTISFLVSPPPAIKTEYKGGGGEIFTPHIDDSDAELEIKHRVGLTAPVVTKVMEWF